MSVSSWKNGRRCGCNFTLTFLCFCILERGIPISAYRCGNLATGSSTSSHCRYLADGLPVLGLSFMLSAVKAYAAIAEMSVLKGLLGRIVVVNRNAPGSSSSLYVVIRRSRHWQQFIAQWCNCLYHSWFPSPTCISSRVWLVLSQGYVQSKG
jgi:hypothetical protein